MQPTLRLDQLGRAKLARITNDETVLVAAGGQGEAVAARIAALRAELEQSTSDFDWESLQNRILALSGGVAVIRVGGASEAEVKKRKDRIDDAVNAVKAAVSEGVVPGGGVALLDAIDALSPLEPASREQSVGVRAVRRALKAPLRQIAENAGGLLVTTEATVAEHTDRGQTEPSRVAA